MNAELKDLKSFVMEELNLVKKMIEDLQSQKATPNHWVAMESLKEWKFDQKSDNRSK